MWVIFLLQKLYKIVDPSLITSKLLHVCPADSSDGLFKQVRTFLYYNLIVYVSISSQSLSYSSQIDIERNKINFSSCRWVTKFDILIDASSYFPLSSFFFLLGNSSALDKLNTIIPTNNNFMLTSPFPSAMWMIEKEIMRFSYDELPSHFPDQPTHRRDAIDSKSTNKQVGTVI